MRPPAASVPLPWKVGQRHHQLRQLHLPGEPVLGVDLAEVPFDRGSLPSGRDRDFVDAPALAMTQPALTRTVAGLERRFGGRLFERLPTGVRPTPLGEQAVCLARGVLREMTDAEEKIGMAVSGREGRFRITATPIWMEAAIAPAAAGFRERLPGVELVLRTAPPAEGLGLREAGESDLHCGGLREDAPLLDVPPTPADLAAAPWIDFDAGPEHHDLGGA